MLHVVTTGAYYPPVDTTWKILTTGASQLTVVSLCSGEEPLPWSLDQIDKVPDVQNNELGKGKQDVFIVDETVSPTGLVIRYHQWFTVGHVIIQLMVMFTFSSQKALTVSHVVE